MGALILTLKGPIPYIYGTQVWVNDMVGFSWGVVKTNSRVAKQSLFKAYNADKI